MSNWRQEIDKYIDSISDELITVRRYLHQHPESSGLEFETTKYLAEQLKNSGINYRIAPSGRGLIAECNSDVYALKIGLRADIDALKIQEENEVEYRSSYDGLMHACGHDAHTAMALGATWALFHCSKSFPWSTRWRTIFQPAEETGKGAFEMIEAGAVDSLRALIAFHVDPETLVGKVGVRSGALTACCESLDVNIFGEGGHAARPHHTTDPISVAIQFIQAVYQFVPRSVDSRVPVVVSFGVIQGGKNPNVIPDRVELRGTIRTLDKKSAIQVREKIRNIGKGLTKATQAQFDISFHAGLNAVINDPKITKVFSNSAAEVVGDEHVEPIELPSMGGEDFSAYLDHVPGSLLRLGVAQENRPSCFLHSPRFDIDEKALSIGAKILARTVVQLSNPIAKILP